MASFRSTVVTNTGIRVINTALANKQELKISSIKSGNGVYTGGENLENEKQFSCKKDKVGR